METVKLILCEACAAKLRAIKERLGEQAMGMQAGPVVSACPKCASQLPPIPGKLLTELAPLERRNAYKG